MTMTESPPSEAAGQCCAAAVGGLYDWLTTSDHKAIGRIWLRFGIAPLLLRDRCPDLFQRLDADAIHVFGGVNSYFQMWSLYRFGIMLMVAIPLFVGLATVITPMQVGSTNIAFPRAALAAAWGYVPSLITASRFSPVAAGARLTASPVTKPTPSDSPSSAPAW